MPQIILLVIFLAEFFTTPLNVLFYDQPEYLRIISTHSFWQVFSLGHFPIHPIFMGILWIGTKFVSANLIALIFGMISTLLVYKISKLIFKKGKAWLAAVIFTLFPAVWIINTNLMIESVSLTFYILSVYLFLKRRNLSFVLSIFLMIGSHLESVFWIPTIFLIPFIFGIKFDKKEAIKWVSLSFISTAISLAFYASIYYFGHISLGGSTEQLFTYFSSGLPRMIRNVWLSFIRGFGSLTPFVIVYLLIKNIKSKKILFAWVAFFAIICLIGANWQGDFMVRRMIFVAVILSLAIYKYLGKYSIYLVLYLIPIVVANGILYYRGSSSMALAVMQKHIDQLPKGQMLLQSHYYKPFTKYDGKILWIGNDDLGQINKYLEIGRRVFITKESVTAPYLLVIGNNYHITSVGKVGESESAFLFKKYSVEPYGGNIEFKLFKGKQVSDQAGEAVISYDQSFFGRLARPRINYGDIGSWVWALVTNHRDPIGWTYKDVRGVWLQVQNTNPHSAPNYTVFSGGVLF
jgi:hypothetical protein